MTWDDEHAYGWSWKQESDSNQLKSIEGYKLAVSPTQADIWFRAVTQRVTAGTEVRGRIVGPRCLFAETVEVASPLRSVRHREGDQVSLIARTAIPEPGFWDPLNPLLYRVVVELWQDGQRCALSGFDLGFRVVEMGSGNVFVNQKPFLLRGMRDLPQSWEEAAARRQEGYNLVLAEKWQRNWWVRASPLGFLLLERATLSTLTPHYVDLLSQQPCFLGFVLDKELLGRSPSENENFLRSWQERRVFIGLELDGPPPLSLPGGLSFLVCPESALPALSTTPHPKIALREWGAGTEGPSARPTNSVLGWIDS
jgi:hypothetical protein